MRRPDDGRDRDGIVVLPPLVWRESPNQSQRRSGVRTVVVHDTEGAYGGAVSWLCNPQARASAHVVVREDGLEATQLVPYSAKAWHCATFNDQTIGIEMAGFARVGFTDPMLRHVARIVAFFLHQYNLPATHVRPDASGRLGKGWTLHQDLGELGGGHVDPGFSAAKAWWFGQLVKSELRRGGFRRSWGHV